MVRLKAQFEVLAGVCEELGKSCYSYADSVDHSRAIKRALIELLAIIALDQTAGWIGGFFTGGTSAVAAQGGMALAISIYGARIAAMIRALIGVVAVSRVPVAVSQAIARASEALIPLIRAQPALAGVEGAVAPGPFTTFANLRRPHLTQQTKDTIIARTRTWGRPGDKEEFYIVESEPNV